MSRRVTERIKAREAKRHPKPEPKLTYSEEVAVADEQPKKPKTKKVK